MSKDGGSAFPYKPFRNPTYPERGDVLGSCGMSLRDYFAAHAPTPKQDMTLEAQSEYRYRYADAMLKVRERQP